MTEFNESTKEVPLYHRALFLGAAALAGIVTVEIVDQFTNWGVVALGAGALVAVGVHKAINYLSRRE